MAEITEFNIGQGETFKILLTVVNDETGVPLDITSQSFFGQIRENYTTDILASTFTFQKIEPYASGSVFVSLSQAQTEELYQRKYVYDILMESGSVTRRILEGYMVVRPATTR
jgi:hypothetical protein